MPDEAFAKAADHQLVILDVVVRPEVRGRDLSRDPRRRRPWRQSRSCASAQTEDVEERIRVPRGRRRRRHGPPFDGRELEARVEALLLRFQRSRDLAPVISADGADDAPGRAGPSRSTAPRAASGTTTIAINIAIAAVAGRPDRVVLVDLALQFGGVATPAQPRPEADARRRRPRRDRRCASPSSLRTYAMRHDSGLHVLAAPGHARRRPRSSRRRTSPRSSGRSSTATTSSSSMRARRSTSASLTILEAAETVILPVYPEIAALKAMHALLEYLSEVGSVGSKTMFVLNNVFAREILKPRDVESVLGTKIVGRAAVRPVPLPEGGQRGRPGRHRCARSTPAERLVKLSSTRLRRGALSAPDRCRGQEVRRPLPATQVKQSGVDQASRRLVPEPRFELGRPCGPRSLSPLRLPFRHSGAAQA